MQGVCLFWSAYEYLDSTVDKKSRAVVDREDNCDLKEEEEKKKERRYLNRDREGIVWSRRKLPSKVILRTKRERKGYSKGVRKEEKKKKKNKKVNRDHQRSVVGDSVIRLCFQSNWLRGWTNLLEEEAVREKLQRMLG